MRRIRHASGRPPPAGRAASLAPLVATLAPGVVGVAILRAVPAAMTGALLAAALGAAAPVAPRVGAQEPPRRVASLVPAATDLVEALGAGDRLVAVTRYDGPGRRARLPTVGGPADPSLETLAGLRPDLVVTWDGVTPPHVTDRLHAMGVRVHGARIETLEDVARTARELGTLLGRAAAADSVATAMTAALDSLRAAAPRRPPSVFLALHPVPPLLTAGAGSYLDELVRLAGGRNLFADAPVRWPTVSAESVLARRPDVVVVAEEDAAAFAGSVLGRALEGPDTPRLLTVPGRLLLRPGPASLDLARRLGRVVAQAAAEGSVEGSGARAATREAAIPEAVMPEAVMPEAASTESAEASAGEPCSEGPPGGPR